MNEWTVVSVVVTLASLYFLIYNPMSKNTKENTKAMTELTMSIKRLMEDFDKMEAKNKESHSRIWAHNKEQDGKINSHETRIQKLEDKE